MDDRAVAFIDGRSIHNWLKSMGLQEQDLDWLRLLDWIRPEGQVLLRAFWYHVAEVPDFDWGAGRATRYCPPDVDVATFLEEARIWHRREQERIRNVQRTVHRQIVRDCDRIEFRYVGVLEVDPFRKERRGEKGLDVGMAVDMVARMDQYDSAILVSAERDFAPAVQVLKDRLKRVYPVTIERGERGNAPRSEARRMRVEVDRVTAVYEEDILNEKNGLLKRS